MKKALSVALYPLMWVLGAFSVLSGNANSVLLAKDIATDRSYDGQAIYDSIERRNA
ncbi:hypothetical protein HF638_19015 [Paenibacillus sp. SZ31]|uniref:hypothetical protein n=1 Tax=Paenibacillus sp. SZ31 TaxID=2725555 RepID=UPI00146D6E58|nr:hypothetical protein [Paenibacillus sp. SZ31]NMI06074.1 hypothetical protein [Paenibacillus sp. SZ31]